MTGPPPDPIRVLHGQTGKRNNREVIALIDSARQHVYFVIYEFTLRDIADALVAVQKRGIDDEGVVDSEESAKSDRLPVIIELIAVRRSGENRRNMQPAMESTQFKALATKKLMRSVATTGRRRRPMRMTNCWRSAHQCNRCRPTTRF